MCVRPKIFERKGEGTQSDSSLGEMAELVESLEARYVRFDHETNRLRE